jgi:hypothetical protein
VQPATGIYLMQLRAQTAAIALPRRRLMISVDLSKTQPLPHPVKINHIGSNGMSANSTRSSNTEVSQVRSKAG